MRKLTMLAAGAAMALTVGIALAQTKETGTAGMGHSSMDMPDAMKGYMGAMDMRCFNDVTKCLHSLKYHSVSDGQLGTDQ